MDQVRAEQIAWLRGASAFRAAAYASYLAESTGTNHSSRVRKLLGRELPLYKATRGRAPQRDGASATAAVQHWCLGRRNSNGNSETPVRAAPSPQAPRQLLSPRVCRAGYWPSWARAHSSGRPVSRSRGSSSACTLTLATPHLASPACARGWGGVGACTTFQHMGTCLTCHTRHTMHPEQQSWCERRDIAIAAASRAGAQVACVR
jgi:hypothetical protein